MFNSGFSILAHFLASALPPRGLSFQKAQNKIKLLLSLFEIMEELHAILKPPPPPPLKRHLYLTARRRRTDQVNA